MRLIARANRFLLGIGLVVAAAGCAGPRHPEAATLPSSTAPPAALASADAGTAPPSASAAADAGAVCPMMAPGVQSSVADTAGGVTITFTAPADRVDALRDAVRQMAAQGDLMASCPCRGMMGDAGAMRGMGGMRGMRGMGGMGGTGGMGGMGGMGGTGGRTMMQRLRIPPANGQEEDVPGGARLTLTAKNPSDIDALRARVRMHVEHMKSGGCPMM